MRQFIRQIYRLRRSLVFIFAASFVIYLALDFYCDSKNHLKHLASTDISAPVEPNISELRVGVVTSVCGPKSSYEDYYDAKYFKWQLQHQLFQAAQASPSRHGQIKPEYAVLEIGCSAGAELNTVESAKKYCVEINSHARQYASEKYNLTTFRCVDELPENSIDYAYSIAVLEHVEAPVTLLRKLHSKMRSGSTLEIAVKNEGFQTASSFRDSQLWSFKKHDLNNHLYTWTSLLLGNMIEAAGFEVINIYSTISAYPPNFIALRPTLTPEQWAKVQEEEGRKQGVESLVAFARKKSEPIFQRSNRSTTPIQ